MRAVLLAIVMVFTLATEARADETYRCWTEARADPSDGRTVEVFVCRIAGSHVVVFVGPGGVPVDLFPAVGTDAGGPCFYWRSVWTGWDVVELDEDGALLSLDPDREPGGFILFDAWVRNCVGEPDPERDPIDLVWEVVSEHDFERPAVVLDPSIGLAGLDTYVLVDVPDVVNEALVSPITGETITIEIGVELVEVSWGDEIETAITPSLLVETSGDRDAGVLVHMYETSAWYNLTTTYEWTVRWRIGAAAEEQFDVAPTATTISYRVDQVVARRIS